jgi:hypothetical protein
MDWTRYKQLCDTPSVFSRWMLEQTLELLRRYDSPSAALERTLTDAAIAKPEDHSGGPATDMFELRLSTAEVVAIVGVVATARSEGGATSATRSRGLGGFLEAWQEYDRFFAD